MKTDLELLFKKALSQGEVFAPVKENDLISFKKVNALSEILSTDDYINTVKPAKEFFFPQREVEYSLVKDAIIAGQEEKQKKILWGIRPCEAKSLLILDKVYLSQDCAENSYKNLRENTVLIGFSCLKAGENCFCRYIGGSPFSSEGLDILITKFGPDEFYAEGVSAIGREWLSSNDLNSKEIERKNKLEKEVKFKREFNVPENLSELFDKNYWGEVSQKCVSCGICRFLCPTCHCFDMGIEESERVKYWDACAFKRFTQEASGVNPRWRKADRYKQWVFHKYDYFKKRNGLHLCVGCGRCIAHCPTRMDIIDIFSGALKG